MLGKMILQAVIGAAHRQINARPADRDIGGLDQQVAAADIDLERDVLVDGVFEVVVETDIAQAIDRRDIGAGTHNGSTSVWLCRHIKRRAGVFTTGRAKTGPTGAAWIDGLMVVLYWMGCCTDQQAKGCENAQRHHQKYQKEIEEGE